MAPPLNLFALDPGSQALNVNQTHATGALAWTEERVIHRILLFAEADAAYVLLAWLIGRKQSRRLLTFQELHNISVEYVLVVCLEHDHFVVLQVFGQLDRLFWALLRRHQAMIHEELVAIGSSPLMLLPAHRSKEVGSRIRLINYARVRHGRNGRHLTLTFLEEHLPFHEIALAKLISSKFGGGVVDY